MDWLRLYLPLYLLLYLLVAFVLPSYRTYRQTGINPLVFGRSDSAHDYTGYIMKLLVAGLGATVLLYAFGGRWYSYLTPIPYLDHRPLQIAGLVIIHTALIWVSIAQYQMRTSWRIGIDERHRTALVTTGVFSLSRNPVFLGMLLSVWGLLLIIPSAAMLVISVTTWVVIQIQIRLEEEFLARQHGDVYRQYKDTVRRLI